ncbi:MAG: aminotransferase class V-fold PLP-dependent enzyme, partial [Candidatus Omnitrophica bacterium]|nr:aminotransferase class V-fold PLP-dependent enzyme [Candidatus Omnitrophota bacterium]
GTGGLYVGERVEKISPWREGGTGMGSEHPSHPKEFPYVLEGGTPNTVGIVGLAEGLKFVAEKGIPKIRAHELELMTQLREGLQKIADGKIKLFGPENPEQCTAALSFTLAGMEPAEASVILDQSFGIATRAGLHCAPLMHEFLGTSPLGTIRISPGFFSTSDDIQSALTALGQMI